VFHEGARDRSSLERLDPDETGVLRVWVRLGGRMAPPRVAALEAENFVIELR